MAAEKAAKEAAAKKAAREAAERQRLEEEERARQQVQHSFLICPFICLNGGPFECMQTLYLAKNVPHPICPNDSLQYSSLLFPSYTSVAAPLAL